MFSLLGAKPVAYASPPSEEDGDSEPAGDPPSDGATRPTVIVLLVDTSALADALWERLTELAETQTA